MHTLKELQDRVSEAFLTARFGREPIRLYDPIIYTLGQGGKRLRPVLVLLSCDLFGGNIEDAIAPAMGLEIFHNFTLLHDDIMDQAPLRRGMPTVFRKWNADAAILSGDTMFVMAYEYVARTRPELLPSVLDLFNETARMVCEGQQYDMDFESQAGVSIDDYMEMIRLKTAVLIACSLKLGAVIAGARDDDAVAVYRFGIELGLAFQLQDDFLDAFGDVAKFGKTIGGDIAENKKTYLFLKAFELATGEQLENLTRCYFSPEMSGREKVSSILGIYEQLDIRRITREAIEYHHTRALDILRSFNFPADKRRTIEHLMQEMLGREK